MLQPKWAAISGLTLCLPRPWHLPFPLPEIPSLVLSSHPSWSLLLRCALKSLLGPSQRFLISSEWSQCGLRCKPDVKRLNSSLCQWYPDPLPPNPGTLDPAASLNTLCTFLIPGLCSCCSLCLGSSVLFTRLLSLWQTPTYQGLAQTSPPLGGYSRSSACGETLSSGSQEYQSPLATLLVKHWAGALEYIFAGWKDKWQSEQQHPHILSGASLVAQLEKNPPAMQEAWVWSLGQEDPLEKDTATHSGILVWRIHVDRGAWQATVHGVTRVRHDLAIKPPPYPLQFFKSSLFSSRNPSMTTPAHWSASLPLLYLFWPCCTACGILVSRPGIESMSPTVEA